MSTLSCSNCHKKFVERFSGNLETPSACLINNLELHINNQMFHKSALLEDTYLLVRYLRKDWMLLQNSVTNGEFLSNEQAQELRQNITQCVDAIFLSLNEYNQSPTSKRHISEIYSCFVTKFIPLVTPIGALSEDVLMKLSPASLANEKLPVPQYFHCFLEIQLNLMQFLCISHKLEEAQKILVILIKDLVILSKKNFKLANRTVFSCNCTKNVWLCLQIFCEKYSIGQFWSLFNQAIDSEKGDFILWLLTEVALLQALDKNGQNLGSTCERVTPNFPQFETALKDVLQNNSTATSADSLLITLQTVTPLLSNLWLKFARIEPYQILWDYFSKRLNLVKPDLNLAHISSNEIMDRIDTILWTPKDCRSNDFEYFLGMLVAHLREHPQQWGKMKGRIYSQLGPNKIKELRDEGIYCVCLLFLSLAGISFDELGKKFADFVGSLAEEKRNSNLVWRFYACLFIRHIRENLTLEQAAPPFVRMLEEASHNHSHLKLVKNFCHDFDTIFQSSPTLQVHQWLLLDNAWIQKYTTVCYYAELVALLNVFVKILERIDRDQVWCDWEHTFKIQIYPALKQASSSLTAPEVCGTLAAKIATLSPALLPEIFGFYNNDSMVPKVSASFLCVILKGYPGSFILSANQETLCVQSWIKSCLFAKDSQDELTKHIMKLSTIPDFVKTQIILQHQSNNKDPLCALIDCLGTILEQTNSNSPKIAHLTRFCEVCFGRTDRWIVQYLSQQQQNSSNDAVTLRIYTIMALAFYKAGPLLYNRHRTSCAFTSLVSVLLLPTELMIGKPPSASVLQAIKKTWHLYFEATLRLKSPTSPHQAPPPQDAFLDRTLRDLIIKYVPHFSIVDSPMLQCLSNERIADAILDKMAVGYLNHPTREAESNVFKCLRILNEFVQSTTSVASVRSVVQRALYGLFEVVMFHNQRNAALNTIKSLMSSVLYSKLKGDVATVVKSLTEKHLAFNAANYFQLMGVLAKLARDEVRSWLDVVRKQVSVVERMRGVGYDATLRHLLNNLESVLK